MGKGGNEGKQERGKKPFAPHKEAAARREMAKGVVERSPAGMLRIELDGVKKSLDNAKKINLVPEDDIEAILVSLEAMMKECVNNPNRLNDTDLLAEVDKLGAPILEVFLKAQDKFKHVPNKAYAKAQEDVIKMLDLIRGVAKPAAESTSTLTTKRPGGS